MDLPTLLGNCQSVDHAVRKQAEDSLAQAANQNMGQLMLSLVAELINEGQSVVIRQQAGVYIKVQLSGTDEDILTQKLNQWQLVEPTIKTQIKNGVLQVLHSPTEIARNTASLIIGKMGAIEMPQNAWPELLPALLNNVTGQYDDAVKIATLQSLGYMCADWEPEDMNQDQTDQILTCIVDGMRSNRPPKIRGAAATALINSLEFTRKNFESKNERDMIMQVVCEATQCEDATVRMAAYEGIWTIATLYYDRLQDYMNALFELTIGTIRTDTEEVSLNAMEFWSSLCDEELEIKDEMLEAAENSEISERTSREYVKQALPALMPVVLETLSKQSEDSIDDPGHWDLAKAGATCLRLIATLVEDDVVEMMVPFVTTYISSDNWRHREAAVMAFGAVLEGPSMKKLANLVHSAMPVLINLMKDGHVMVKDSATWTIGKICELHGPSIPNEVLTPLVEALLLALDDSPSVCSKACFALHNFGEQFEGGKDEPTNALSAYLSPLVQKLLMVVQKDDGGDANMRSEAVEAMNVLIKNSAKDMRPVVQSTLDVVLSLLERTFSMQVLTADDRDRVQGLQSLLCGNIQVICLKMESDVAPFADRIMTMVLEVFKNKQAVAQEEAFMAAGALADQLEKRFINYMEAFQPILVQGLSNHEEFQVCIVTVGVVGDLCRALEGEIRPYTDMIMTLLLQNLENASINRNVKPPVLACLGDIALAIGPGFQAYLQVTMNMLEQAQQACRVSEGQDEEMVDYINSLREGVLEAYSGIAQGLNEQGNNQMTQLIPYLPGIVAFLEILANDATKDESVLKNAIGLVGDLAQGVGQGAGQYLKTSGIIQLLMEGETHSETPQTKELSHWAKQMVYKNDG